MVGKNSMHAAAYPLPGKDQNFVRIPKEIFFFPLNSNFIKIHTANDIVSGKISSGRKEAKKWSSRNLTINNF